MLRPHGKRRDSIVRTSMLLIIRSIRQSVSCRVLINRSSRSRRCVGTDGWKGIIDDDKRYYHCKITTRPNNIFLCGKNIDF